MEFTVNRKVFQEAVQKTLGIVDRKATISVLNNILIKTQNNSIRVVANDREIGMLADYDAQVTKQGEITVAARKLYEMLKEMEDDTICFISNENNWVSIVGAKVQYRIPGLGSDDFPEVREDDDVRYFDLPCKIAREMIEKTFFAASNDDMRPGLNGVYLKKEGSKIEMVATDGHRLAMSTKEIGNSERSEVNVEGIIIPKKGINEIRRLVDDELNSIQFGITKGVCIAKKAAIMLRVSLIDSVYPEYGKVIPKAGGTKIMVDRSKMLHSLRRMSVMSSEMFSGVKIHLSEGKMTLNSINPEIGEANDEIDVFYEGEPMNIGYNVRYLIDAIEVLDEELISFELRSNEGPGVIRSAENDTYLCVVMPIKLGKEQM
ncbi:MAG: DNA polymerase III subunit beta [Syntrophales bacterium]|jgi:DNA polymerase-3 subunit beta|nr:DNA polymerase III subunit beta [Syntrophales bacterium]MDY0044530.1 DNA polymerase III subunit beta [Syntrophales bacterium]